MGVGDDETSDAGAGGDASTASIRYDLVETASKFLTNPKVSSRSEREKMMFLDKKGLTPEEIRLALNQAPRPNRTTQQMTVALKEPMEIIPHRQPLSLWIRFRDLCNFVVFLSGAAYGIYYLYINFIGPVITGRKRNKQKTAEESVLEVQKSILNVIQEIQTKLTSMDQSLMVHSNELRDIQTTSDKHSLDSLKTELSSVKSLLLNRNSFPANPGLAPSIPSWQQRAIKEPQREPLVELPQSSTVKVTDYQPPRVVPALPLTATIKEATEYQLQPLSSHRLTNGNILKKNEMDIDSETDLVCLSSSSEIFTNRTVIESNLGVESSPLQNGCAQDDNSPTGEFSPNQEKSLSFQSLSSDSNSIFDKPKDSPTSNSISSSSGSESE